MIIFIALVIWYKDTENLRINNKYIIKQKNKNIDVSQSEIEKQNLEYIKQKCELYLFDEK